MRETGFLCLILIGLMMVASCNDEETYADQKKRERSAINKYIADSAVTVISEDEFSQGHHDRREEERVGAL